MRPQPEADLSRPLQVQARQSLLEQVGEPGARYVPTERQVLLRVRARHVVEPHDKRVADLVPLDRRDAGSVRRPRQQPRSARHALVPNALLRQHHRSVAQRRLLDATVECLVKHGYAHTTTTLVCERAGVSRGALLHHFPKKAELVRAAIEHVFERRLEEFRRAMAKVPSSADRTSITCR